MINETFSMIFKHCGAFKLLLIMSPLHALDQKISLPNLECICFPLISWLFGESRYLRHRIQIGSLDFKGPTVAKFECVMLVPALYERIVFWPTSSSFSNFSLSYSPLQRWNALFLPWMSSARFVSCLPNRDLKDFFKNSLTSKICGKLHEALEFLIVKGYQVS